MVTGHDYPAIAERFNVSAFVACTTFWNVLHLFLIVFRDKMIHLPSRQEMIQIRQKMEQRGDDVQDVLFIIDGTHHRANIVETFSKTQLSFTLSLIYC